MRRLHLFLAAGVGVAAAAVALGPKPSERTRERLFLALEVRDDGRLVARPKIVGETDKPVRVTMGELDGASAPKMTLALTPRAERGRYRLGVVLGLRSRLEGGQREVMLGHGEEAEIEWRDDLGTVTLRVMLMRVASPEFQAYMDVAAREATEGRI